VWRTRWDWALFIGGAVPALILGVAVGNTLRGVPFHFTDDLRPIYEGTLFGLLNPVALYCGLVSVSMLVMHGAAWLAFKSDGLVAARAKEFGVKAAIASSILFAGGGLLVWLGLLGGYRVTSPIVWGGPSNPLLKTVIADPAAWFTNFDAHPSLWMVPALGVAAPLAAALGFRAGREVLTFFASKLAVAAIIATVGLSMFPILLPSSSNPNQSLAAFDSSSSHATLLNMLVATVFFMPIILAYTAWVYRVLRGKVTAKSVATADASAY
jgi:cytochrome d ubiquinol oxidase subunit II